MSIFRKFKESSTEVSHIQTLCVCAMMLALRIVLGVFTNFTLSVMPFVKVGFSFIPIVIVAMLYGPVCAAIVAGAGDLLSIVLANPTSFSIMPGITVCCVIEGLILGLCLYKSPLSITRVIIAKLLVLLLCTLPLNTFVLYTVMGISYLQLLIYRACILVPFAVIEVIISFAVLRVISRIPVLKKA